MLLDIIKFIEKYDVSISFSHGCQDDGIVVDLHMPKCGERTYAKLTYYNMGEHNNLIYRPLSNDVILSDIYNTLSEFYKEE